MTAEQGETLWQCPDTERLKGKRDREQHWAIVDLREKAGHVRTVPMPDWVKAVLDVWLRDAGIAAGPLFRCVNRAGRLWGERITEKVVWHVVRDYAAKAAIEKLAPHDLRRTCARLCHSAGGELEQIQFLLGHVSIQTTERYLGLNHICAQKLGACWSAIEEAWARKSSISAST